MLQKLLVLYKNAFTRCEHHRKFQHLLSIIKWSWIEETIKSQWHWWVWNHIQIRAAKDSRLPSPTNIIQSDGILQQQLNDYCPKQIPFFNVITWILIPHLLCWDLNETWNQWFRAPASNPETYSSLCGWLLIGPAPPTWSKVEIRVHCSLGAFKNNIFIKDD